MSGCEFRELGQEDGPGVWGAGRDGFQEAVQCELGLERGAGFYKENLRFEYHGSEERNHREKTQRDRPSKSQRTLANQNE